MADRWVGELKDTIYAAQAFFLDRKSAPWVIEDPALREHARHVRNLRRAMHFSFILALAMPLIAFRDIEGVGDFGSGVFTCLVAIVLATGLWRGTLRSARNLAQCIRERTENGEPHDSEHPRVIYGQWVPKGGKTLKERIPTVRRRK